MNSIGSGEAANGTSVALSFDGNRVAIGAAVNENAGRVRIYDFVESQWMQSGSTFEGQAAGDRFGESVSLSSDGNRLAIGAPFHDGTNGVGASGCRWGPIWMVRRRMIGLV